MEEDGLADAFRTGSAEGFRAVYERYSGAVFTIALRILGDRELAADAVQVTFLNAWRACGSLEPGRPLAPWLFTIARRAAIDLYRRRAHGPEPVEPKDEAAIVLPPSLEGIWEAPPDPDAPNGPGRCRRTAGCRRDRDRPRGHSRARDQ